ncbi:TRAM domain-containing protein, partial [Thermodesulfobacteriota bacterium]
PEMAITSDLIVGFPGETEEDFHLTIDLITKIGFDNTYSFKYSDRRGTRAENMDGKLSEGEKGARLAELQELQKQITLEKNRALKGRQVDVLVEGKSKKGGQMTGRTGDNKIVNFLSENIGIGLIVKVLIKDALANSLRGELVQEPVPQTG